MAQTYEVAFVGTDGTDESQLVISIRHPDPTATADSINLKVSPDALLEFAKHIRAVIQDAADAEAQARAEPQQKTQDAAKTEAQQ